MTVLGFAITLLWTVLCLVWAVMSIPGGLMANASGGFSPNAHMTMLVLLAIGQVIVLAAGIPGGRAFFEDADRAHLLWWMAKLVALGVALQIGAVAWFFTFGRR